jgi:hypothetical protein
MSRSARMFWIGYFALLIAGAWKLGTWADYRLAHSRCTVGMGHYGQGTVDSLCHAAIVQYGTE